MELLRAFAREAAGGTGPLLDAGCGTGRLFTALRGWGVSKVLGVDASGGMLSVAERLHPGVPTCRGTLQALPLPDASVHAYLAWYSIIHTPPEQLPTVAAEAARVLGPGGRLLWAFHAGAEDRPSKRLDADGRPLAVYGHSVQMSAAILAGAGFEVVAASQRAPREAEQDPQGFVQAVLA